MSDVRVRFAPSPTGELHVGGLRTALFNYLFARREGGTFVLRIEDTDRTRYVPEAEERLMALLDWAGIVPDEGPRAGGPHGPYRQSERLAGYRETAEALLASGHAYRCYCSPETLEDMRREQQTRKLPVIKYDGRCRDLTEAERAAREARGGTAVVRMRMPEPDETIVVHDLVRGDVAIDTAQLDDSVLIKSDGYPTYHLAVVTDDRAMGITHVLRAEEWLPSTPKHLLLYRWLGWDLPRYAHLPLLLNPDRSKMSKRKGDVSVEAFRDQGYLPQALVNFVALLGWSPGDDRELFSLEELADAFSLERIGKTGAVFDRDKLDWMNQQYIQSLDPDALYRALRPFIDRTPFAGEDVAKLRKVVVGLQTKLTRLTDIEGRLDLFFRDEGIEIAQPLRQKLRAEEARRAFEAFRERVAASDTLDSERFRAIMKEVSEHTGVKGKSLWEPMRIALTYDTAGPELPLVVDVIGKQAALHRIDRALAE